MMIIRPIKRDDAVSLERCAFSARLGMTHLPKNREVLKRKIEASLIAFSKDVMVPQNEEYLFVLENTENQKMGGVCGISSKMGAVEPSYFFRIEEYSVVSKKGLPISKETRVLHPGKHQNGPSEICALYLLPEFRSGGWGKLLSLSRFLFIAAFRQRFESFVIAEMRGAIDDQNRSPFWEGVGSRFIDLTFEEVMNFRMKNGDDFMADVFPRYPIYVNFLSKMTQEAIGNIHLHTKPALSMLLNQGFQFIQEIDFFDGGPDIGVNVSDVKAIKESVVGIVAQISKVEFDGKMFLIGNEKLDFRVCFGNIRNLSDGTEVMLSSDVAKALNVSVGEKIRYTLP